VRTRGAASAVTALAAALVLGSLWLSEPALAQFEQQAKLTGTGAVGRADQGSVALSADGNTAVVGGPDDDYNNRVGAAWVFTRSGGAWTQQGAKLVGTGAVKAAQGSSVALSADGNTAIVGGLSDNQGVGAAWVFTRSGGAWAQQGAKLVGTGAVKAAQGSSVALSADGNTAIVGGRGDNQNVGAAWVFTRNGGVWTQQGAKLIGAGPPKVGLQGWSVALSADGNTAIVGGGAVVSRDSSSGGAWVFTRSRGVWTQQGGPIGLGGGAKCGSVLGLRNAVALSADGNTALVGGCADNHSVSSVFTRSGEVWTQQGSTLVGSGAAGWWESQGYAVALSADGNIAIVGGPMDGQGFIPPDPTAPGAPGAVWVFTRNHGIWTQQGSKLVGSGGGAFQGGAVAISANGNTMIVSGSGDHRNEGAAWVFVRSAGKSPQ
jgi:hypothetical protein